MDRGAKRAINKYVNPVLIKPAIKKDAKFEFNEAVIKKALERDENKKQASFDVLGKRIKNRYKDLKPSGGVEESKEADAEAKQEKDQKLDKVKKLISGHKIKNFIMNTNDKNNSDDKTVQAEYNQTAEDIATQKQTNFNTMLQLIEELKDQPKNKWATSLGEKGKKLRDLAKPYISSNTQKLGTIIEKIQKVQANN